MRLDVTMAEMGREGSKAGKLCSPFTLQRLREKHCSGGGENMSPESSSHLLCTDKHQAWLTSLLSCTDSECSPWKFLSRPFLCILPSLFWLSVRSWSHHCHSCYDISIFWQVYMLLSLPAKLFSTQPAPGSEPGSTTGKHGQQYLILLHAEDRILIENCLFYGDSTFK